MAAEPSVLGLGQRKLLTVKQKQTIKNQLIRSIEEGDLASVKTLIKENAYLLNSKLNDCDDTALHIVMALQNDAIDKNKRLAIVTWLLGRGASINQQNRFLETPLYLAAQHDCLEIAQLLLDRKADPYLADDRGHLPLEIAIQRHSNAVATELINRNLVKVVENDDPIVLRLLRATEKLINRNPVKVVENDDSIARWLLLATEHGNTEIVKLLITEKKGNPNQREISYYNDGNTLLHIAAKGNHVETTRMLIALGANIDERNDDRERAKDVAPLNAETAQYCSKKYQKVEKVWQFWELPTARRTSYPHWLPANIVEDTLGLAMKK